MSAFILLLDRHRAVFCVLILLVVIVRVVAVPSTAWC